MTLSAHADNVGALAVWFYAHANHDVWICTARQPSLGATVAFQTDTWLRGCGINPCHNYLGVITAEGDDKADVYAHAGIEYSIDDKTETVEHCDTHPLLKHQKHKAFLLDRPWNTGANVQRRVKSVEDFLKEIRG
jgi:hypothetical protein